MKDNAGYLLNFVTLSVLRYRMVVELSHYLHHGTGYLLNSLTHPVLCSRIFAEICHTIFITLPDICYKKHKHSVKYPEPCAVCTSRKSHAAHFIKNSNSKLVGKYHPSSLPFIYEKSQRLLPSLGVHFIDTVGNT